MGPGVGGDWGDEAALQWVNCGSTRRVVAGRLAQDCHLLKQRVGQSPLNSHLETGRRRTICVASVALAIERSACFVDVWVSDVTKMDERRLKTD